MSLTTKTTAALPRSPHSLDKCVRSPGSSSQVHIFSLELATYSRQHPTADSTAPRGWFQPLGPPQQDSAAWETRTTERLRSRFWRPGSESSAQARGSPEASLPGVWMAVFHVPAPGLCSVRTPSWRLSPHLRSLSCRVRAPALWPHLVVISSTGPLLQVQPPWVSGLGRVNLEGTL